MKVESLKISKVFQAGGDIHYILPRFQREYAWEKPNWQTLLDDIYSIYEIYDQDREPEHFMGAMVVINDGHRSGTVSAFKLVDGQQRLTTISLALCALGNLVKESHPKIHRKISKMLINEDEQGEIRYKLLPTEKYDDRFTYQTIIDGESAQLNGNIQSRIKDAYIYLYKQLEKWLQGDVDPEKLFLVFANCLQVVFIDLDKRERPFEIFESLNAKGKPLTQPDLVRNFIAMMLPEDRQGDAFENWVDIENRLREDRTVSRIGELTAFLRHYLACRNGVLPNKGHVYARFRDRIQRDLPQTDEAFTDEIQSLQRFATYYEKFLRPENEQDTAIRERLRQLQVVESVTAYPFLLSLFEDYRVGHIQRSDMIAALSLVENYLIRRFLANEPTGYINKMFPTLAHEVSWSNVEESLKAALLRRNYPSDARVKSALPDLAIYTNRNRERLVFVLEKVNQYLSSVSDGYTVLKSAPTIEHIMPQGLTNAWKETLGPGWDTTHRDMLHTIGNLTLVTQNWNSTLSNGDWSVKKDKFARHALRINYEYFADEQIPWNREEIERRAQWLTDIILKIWPAFGAPPVAMSYKGRTPTSLIISGEHYDVKSWRDVALQTVEFAVVMADNFDRFAENLQSAYLSREKKDRSRQLSNGWWLYLNLSADSVIALCYRIFEQLQFSDEDWEVKLLDE